MCIDMFSKFLIEFKNTADEFTPYPFWFLNDFIDKAELVRQIKSFKEHGINGFVIHPRIGWPAEIPYMSDEFLDIIELCVNTAAKLDMKIILYDEASYPSGSACGLVVKSNPAFASRMLSVCRKNETILLENEYIILQNEEYNFVLKFTGGRIRGLHITQDDNMPAAPYSSDLLNSDAVEAFINFTHEAYFKKLGEYFGSTVIGIFTDEPSLTGRGAVTGGSLPWSGGMYEEFISNGGNEDMLAALFFDMGKQSKDARAIYNKTVCERLHRVYYKKLFDWCSEHGIALMGHPAESSDIGAQKYFHIPGQDLVWRYISPDNNLEEYHSVNGKCSADAARHLGKRRNSNEVFGVCGKKGNPWDFTPSDMLWYLNYLFARGVNMIIPHAFYYSLRTPVQWNERPPDAGPNHIIWNDYNLFSDYIKRLCMINTDSRNITNIAVLCEGSHMPYKQVIKLFENGIDFNYFDVRLFEDGKADIKNGVIKIGDYKYDILLMEESFDINKIKNFINKFISGGGKIYSGDDFYSFVHDMKNSDTVKPYPKTLRKIKLDRLGIPIFIFINEAENSDVIETSLYTDEKGTCYKLNPYSSEITIIAKRSDGTYPLVIEPRIAAVYAFDKSGETIYEDIANKKHEYLKEEIKIENNKFYADEAGGEIKYYVKFDDVCDGCEITVNGKKAGKLYFIPWELNITKYIREGLNDISFITFPSMANKYGKPKKTGCFGAVIVKIKT